MYQLLSIFPAEIVNADIIISPVEKALFTIDALVNQYWPVGVAVAAVIAVTLLILRRMKKKEEEN